MLPDSLKAELEQDPQAWVDTCWVFIQTGSEGASALSRSVVVILHVQDGRALVSNLWEPMSHPYWVPLDSFRVEYSSLSYLARVLDLIWVRPGTWVYSQYDAMELRRDRSLRDAGFTPFWRVLDLVGTCVVLNDKLGPAPGDPVIRVRPGARWQLTQFLRHFRSLEGLEWEAARRLYGGTPRVPPTGTGMPAFEGRVMGSPQAVTLAGPQEFMGTVLAPNSEAQDLKQPEAEEPVQDRWDLLRGGVD